MTDCPKEQTSQHEGSPGTVSDHEVVCRGAYDPIHFSKASSIKSAFVRPAHLVAGELSVWRLERDPAFGVAQVVAKLQSLTAEGQTLRQVQAASVAAIRGIRMPDLLDADQHIFCVIDDCRTDDDGGWHPEHAAIAMEEVEGIIWAVGSDPFDSAKEGLATLLRAQTIWKAAA